MKNNTTHPRLRKHQFVTINTGTTYYIFLPFGFKTHRKMDLKKYTHSVFFELHVCYPFQFLSIPSLRNFYLDIVL